MRPKCWYHTLPGVIAAMGWMSIFVYAMLRALSGHWWMIVATLTITLLAGAFNTAIAMQAQQKKGAVKKRPSVVPLLRRPGTH